MSTEDDLRRIALALPHTTERSAYRTPAFYVGSRMFARITEEPGVAVIWRSDLGEREALLQGDPQKFFTTAHYDGHPSVLARLPAIDDRELAEVVYDAWMARAQKRHLLG